MAGENNYMKKCACGRTIKQKYFKKCIHCQQADKKARKELRKLVKSMKARPVSNHPLLDYIFEKASTREKEKEVNR